MTWNGPLAAGATVTITITGTNDAPVIAEASAAETKLGIGAHVNNADMGAVQASLLENIKKGLTQAGIWA